MTIMYPMAQERAHARAIVREPQIEGENDERDNSGRHDTHRKGEGDFPFQLRAHGQSPGSDVAPLRSCNASAAHFCCRSS
jgi:hypothetical protein